VGVPRVWSTHGTTCVLDFPLAGKRANAADRSRTVGGHPSGDRHRAVGAVTALEPFDVLPGALDDSTVGRAFMIGRG
jgi:hypothetical protein